VAADVGRVVALGASNLALGFPTVVATAREAWGRDVEILAALGHGRSYGARSRVAFRRLPGILESGLWSELESRPPLATRAVVTDVGNDIAYGFSAEQTLAWVEEAVRRLGSISRDIVVTSLPLASLRTLSKARFLAFRTILVPSCWLSLSEVVEAAERVNVGLAKLSAAADARLVHVDPAWYGFDPIHVRRSRRRDAWRRILGAEAHARLPRPGALEDLRVRFLRPERRWLFGVEQLTRQSGVALPSGGRVWLY
jgi:hypothetical protein